MNPYQQWLGLYNFSGVKPNYYELLGLQFGESNPYVIEQAANEMATRLNSVNPGPDVALWNSIMAEIQNAQMCLCNPASRMDYDNSLRGGMGGFGGGYSAGAAFGGGYGQPQMAQPPMAQPPMAQPPMPPVSGGFGGGYSAGAAFGGSPAPQMAAPPIPSAPPVPSSPVASSPTPVQTAKPTTSVAAPVATAVVATAVGATAVGATAVASTAKASTPPAPPSQTGGANLNLENSKKKKVHKKASGGAGSGALYGIYTALALGGLILLLWLFSLTNSAKDSSVANNQSQSNDVVDSSSLQGTSSLPRTVEKNVDPTDKVKPVAAPKRRVVSRRNKEGIPVREVVDADNGEDNIVIGNGKLIDGEVTDDAPDIRELGVSDVNGGAIVERADDFSIGTNRVVVDDNDNVDSVEEAIEHTTGIDIAPNEDGEPAPNFSARHDEGGNVEIIDDPRLGTGFDGAVQTVRRSRPSVFDSDKPVVENVKPNVEPDVKPVTEPGVSVPNSAPDDVSYDNIADDLVIEKDFPNIDKPEPAAVEPKVEQPAPAVEEPKAETPTPAAEEPKAETPAPAPAAEEPKAAEPAPAVEEPKAETPAPAPAAEEPKAAEPAPAAEEPKAAEPAKPAKADIPKESELMAAQARIEANNASALKSADVAGKVSLAQKLIDDSASQSPADRYAALTKARDLATDAQNVDVAMKAIELKSKAFNNADSYNEGLDVLLSCKPNAWPESQKKAVVAAAEKWLKVAKKNNESRNVKKLQEIIDANK